MGLILGPKEGKNQAGGEYGEVQPLPKIRHFVINGNDAA
jgi:hypothetical protein